jgi:hypothetical protein
MASQTQIKNTTIPVTGIITPKGNGGKVSVSKSGPDVGFITTAQNSDGTFLTRTEAVTVSQNPTNTTKINAALTASKSTSTLQGVVAQSAYDQNIKSTPTGVPTSTTNQIPAANAANPKITNNSPKGINTGKVYTFPVDMRYSGAGSQDHIRIMGLKYKAPQGAAGFGSVLTDGLKSSNAGLPPSGYAYEGEVILPIPTAVRDRSSASWSMSKMSPIMAAGVGAVADPAIKAAGGDVMGGLIEFYKRMFKSGPDFLGAGGTEFREIMAASMSSAFLGSVGLTGLEPSDILARTSGRVSNPNMELLFRGPNMRQFEFSWKFACRSADDAKRIRQIIKFMKLQCLPEVEDNTNLINSPNVFFIRYVNGNTRIKSLPQPKICALLEFGIDHTPDGMGWAAYEDSHPVSTALVMQFAELTPLFRNEMEEYFPEEDDVGF